MVIISKTRKSSALDRRGHVLFLSGLAVQLMLLGFTVGTPDIVKWVRFATRLDPRDPLSLYLEGWYINHPPLALFLAWMMLKLSTLLGCSFATLFRGLSIVSLGGISLLVAERWRSFADELGARKAFLTCWLCPNLILIAGFHGNTDMICIFFLVLAISLLEARRGWFLAGLAYSVSVNIKIIPLIVLFPLLSCFDNWKQALRFLAGCCAVPLLTCLCFGGNYWLMYYRIFHYKSLATLWGIPFLLRSLDPVLPDSMALSLMYHRDGPILLLAGSIILGFINAWRRRFSFWEIASLSLALWLFLASGFGVQYIIYSTPFFLGLSLSRGALFGVFSGIYLLAFYVEYLIPRLPLRSVPDHPLPNVINLLGVLTWVLLALITVDLFRKRSKKVGAVLVN